MPRTIFNDKPLNTTGYFNQIYNMDTFEKGYILPITIFGVFYATFGFFGLIIISYITGLFAKIMDNFSASKSSQGYPIIASYFIFSLLRDDPSISFFQYGFACVTYFLVRKITCKVN
jgi:hypothetical protein